jgi:hypothetical protein
MPSGIVSRTERKRKEARAGALHQGQLLQEV